MTQRWYVRAALAALVGLGAAAGLARAQPPAPAPAPMKEPWAVIEYGPGGPGYPQPVQPVQAAAAPGAAHHPILDWLYSRPRPIVDSVHDCMHAKGVGCWSHPNAYTCGSLKSECSFIFGSCREFFGEPCLPGPPPPPAVPGAYPPPPGWGPAGGYGPAYGYGYGPAQQRRGGCPSCQ